MQTNVLVHWSPGVEFHLRADPANPLTADAARAWLEAEFTAMECEPLRALGKVLTADKVLRVTEAAGPDRLRDPVWSAAYARAVLAAIGKPVVRVDVQAMALSY